MRFIQHSAQVASSLKFHRPANAGFTIVELLIVIVVIGILAAIVIVAFNGVQQRARDATVQSNLTGFHKKAELFRAENGRYPVSEAELATLGVKFNKDVYRGDVSSSNQVNLHYCTTRTASAGAPLGGKYVLMTVTADNKQVKIGSESNGQQTDTDAWESGWNARCKDGINCELDADCPGFGTTSELVGFNDVNTPMWRPWTGVSN